MRQINLVEGKVVAPEGMKVGIVADYSKYGVPSCNGFIGPDGGSANEAVFQKKIVKVILLHGSLEQRKIKI